MGESAEEINLKELAEEMLQNLRRRAPAARRAHETSERRLDRYAKPPSGFFQGGEFVLWGREGRRHV